MELNISLSLRIVVTLLNLLQNKRPYHFRHFVSYLFSAENIPEIKRYKKRWLIKATTKSLKPYVLKQTLPFRLSRQKTSQLKKSDC